VKILTNTPFIAERVCFFDGTERRNCTVLINGGFLQIDDGENALTLYNLSFVKKIEGISKTRYYPQRER